MTVIPPELLNSKGGGFTVNVNVVARTFAPLEPVTVIVVDPRGVYEEVAIVHVLENVGLPETGVNDVVAPDGSPEAERVTVSAKPLVKVIVILLEPETPRTTVIPPLLPREKSNGGGFTVSVNVVVRVLPPPEPLTVIV